MLSEAKKLIENALTLVGWGAAIAFATMVALFFFSFAAFVWAEENYGTVRAALSLGLFFLLVAVTILLTALVIRHRSLNRQEPKSNQQWWMDPAVVATGIELVRIVGVRRIIPAVALSAVILGALQDNRGSKARSTESK